MHAQTTMARKEERKKGRRERRNEQCIARDAQISWSSVRPKLDMREVRGSCDPGVDDKVQI